MNRALNLPHESVTPTDFYDNKDAAYCRKLFLKALIQGLIAVNMTLHQ